MKTVQYFSDEYLTRCKELSTEQIAKFLDDFRLINSPRHQVKTKLISLKVETDLLDAFKVQSRLDGVPYQSRIKKIMRDWLSDNDPSRAR